MRDEFSKGRREALKIWQCIFQKIKIRKFDSKHYTFFFSFQSESLDQVYNSRRRCVVQEDHARAGANESGIMYYSTLYTAKQRTWAFYYIEE